ncbi:two-component sensor histidine kinase, partial [Streptomyces mirabilis]
MRLSTRIALAVGATVPVLVLATGWLLLRLVAADLHDQQDTHLRERAVAVAKDARSLLRASAALRAGAGGAARGRRGVGARPGG